MKLLTIMIYDPPYFLFRLGVLNKIDKLVKQWIYNVAISKVAFLILLLPIDIPYLNNL